MYIRISGACALTVALVSVVGLVALAPRVAHAGIAECGNIRIEADAQCELWLEGSCAGGCSADIYKTACATHQHEVCDQECTLLAEPTCTDSCTETCDDQCAQGIEIVCHGNCFPECTVGCIDACADAEDGVQCRASCEATCDAECDHQCAQLPVDASCYTHCIECCGGSCNAEANMDCQVSCQTETWEQCEYDLELSCNASCDLQGALVCDGQFILAGAQLDACVDALLARGLDVRGGALDEVEDAVEEIEDGLEDQLDPFDADGDGHGGGCLCNARGGGSPAFWGLPLLVLGLLGIRRFA